ncbi:MAG: TMEM43 family protein [Bacteroidales bacterium]|nr:TMEM43 family protein [Bacteroidales bacterium]
MAYTEVTRTGYGTRLKNSLGGVLIGILMFIGGTILLWWNEGRAVKTSDMLKEGQKNYVEMENPAVKSPDMEGQLVHAVALATTTDSLSDGTFNVGAVAVKLHRTVEYYQWIEHEKTVKKDKIGGAQETTHTYTYSKEWTGSPVISGEFKDPDYQALNFVYQNLEDASSAAENVSFGAYRLNSSQVGSFHNEQPMAVTLDEDLTKQMDKAARDNARAFLTRGGLLDLVPDSAAIVHTQGNVVYIGRNPNVPEVGDVRITFTKDMPSKVSLIAKVIGDTFTYYKAKNGYKLDLLYMGENTAEEMFDSEHATNKMILWLLRILGVIIIIAGLRSIVSIVPTLLKVLPFLGGIVETGLGLVCGIIGLVWSLIVIAVAWLRYRPILGISLLVLAGLLIFWLIRRSRKKKAAKADIPEPQAPQAPEIQIPQYQQPSQTEQPQMTPEQQKEFEQWKQFQEFKKMQDQMNNQQNNQ